MTGTIRNIAIILAMTLALASCHSSKTGSSSASYTPASLTPERTAAQDFAMMTGAYAPWSTLQVPVKVSLQQPKKVSVSGTLTMARGSALSLSLKMLFFEVGTLYADADSVVIVSKAMGAYYAESLSAFTAATGMTIADLQSLLLGQAFNPGHGAASADDISSFTIIEDTALIADAYYGWTIRPRRTSELADWHFTAVSPRNTAVAAPQLLALSVSRSEGRVEIGYADSTVSPAGVIASTLQIEGNAGSHSLAATITGAYADARWNTGSTPRRPAIPKGAKRLSNSQLIRMLGEL